MRRAAVGGVTWPVTDEFDEAELDRRLFPDASEGTDVRAVIDAPANESELKRRDVTLARLLQELLAKDPGGDRYSWICELHRAWKIRFPRRCG